MSEQDTAEAPAAAPSSTLSPLVKQGGPVGVLAAGLLLLFNQVGALDGRMDAAETAIAVADNDLTEVVDVVDALHPRAPSVGLSGGGADDEAARKYKLGQLRKRAEEERKAEAKQQELIEEIEEVIEQLPEDLLPAPETSEIEPEPDPEPEQAVEVEQEQAIEWLDPQLDLGLIPDCLGCHEPHPLESVAPADAVELPLP